MANRAGLRKVVKTVRGKHGTVRRSYWVRAQGAVASGVRAAASGIRRGVSAVGSFARAHPLVTAGLVAGAAYGTHALLMSHGIYVPGMAHAAAITASRHISTHFANASVGVRQLAARAQGHMSDMGFSQHGLNYGKKVVNLGHGIRGLAVANSDGSTSIFSTTPNGARIQSGW